ncbi:MAG: hypothetical protein D6680_07905, partial [Cyanobacteria bacterium J007]
MNRLYGYGIAVSRLQSLGEVREHHCPECGYRTHRDCAAAEMVLHRGLENVVTQGLWGTETACQVGLSGVDDLDKWR